MERFMEEQGYDCCFLGLRMDESRVRARHLTERGFVYRRGPNRSLTCCPVANWHTEAIFHVIEATNWPLNAAYPKMTELGIEPKFQRVGPLPLVPRRTLAEGWPDLLTRLESRYGRRW